MRLGWRLTGYLALRCLAGTLAATAVVATVVGFVDFVELTRITGPNGEIRFLQIFGLTLLKAPTDILALSPFTTLFGSFAAFSLLNRRHEFVALRALGVSAWSFLAPAMAAILFLGVALITMAQPIAAQLTETFEVQRNLLSGAVESGSKREVWLRQGVTGQQTVIHALERSPDRRQFRLRRVSLFIQSVDPQGGLTFARRVDAAEALLTPGSWRLTDAVELHPDGQIIRAEQLALPSDLDPSLEHDALAPARTIGLWDLPQAKQTAARAGYPVASYQLRLDDLMALPLLLASMAAVAGAFSIRLPRRGNIVLMALIGLGLGFGVYLLDQFCQALGVSGAAPTWLAAWTPPCVAILAASSILVWTEDG